MLRVRGNRLYCGDHSYACAIGHGGLIAAEDKREGDGCTPLGTWPLRECWYRADRLPAPATQLPLRIITLEDGWCDDPTHPLYNKHFTIPSIISPPPGEGNSRELPHSYERLWREDHAYDLIVPLGYNDDPVVPGKGSAIFLHCAKADYTPTEGCVALAREELLMLLPWLSTASTIAIGSENAND